VLQLFYLKFTKALFLSQTTDLNVFLSRSWLIQSFWKCQCLMANYRESRMASFVSCVINQ